MAHGFPIAIPPQVPTTVVNLGWCMARLERTQLTIVAPRDTSAEPIIPTQEVYVAGLPALRALADLLAPYQTQPSTPKIRTTGEEGARA